jgi:hypothetical protein
MPDRLLTSLVLDSFPELEESPSLVAEARSISTIPLKSGLDCSKSMPFPQCENRYLARMKTGGSTTKF